MPKCQVAKGYIRLREKDGDIFYVLRSGQLHIPSNLEEYRTTSDYCVNDIFGEETSTVSSIFTNSNLTINLTNICNKLIFCKYYVLAF